MSNVLRACVSSNKKEFNKQKQKICLNELLSLLSPPLSAYNFSIRKWKNHGRNRYLSKYKY